MKPTIPKGTRDFGPDKMVKRNYIFQTIRTVFQRFGFQPLETPSMENLSVLMGKYGEEGDQLLFKIVNSGDFAQDLNAQDLAEGSKKILPKIAEKGLRYDLTVPFARYVVMNRNELPMPFKRYQIQPVWRADRPQKGRYREFYQCDADVVGTDSLLCEAEIVLMIEAVMTTLGIPFELKINNRKILTGISEAIGEQGKEGIIATAIDKLDKIGQEGVNKELSEKGISYSAIEQLPSLLNVQGNNQEKLATLEALLVQSEEGKKGLEELKTVFRLVSQCGLSDAHIAFDPTLARGLSYYTGAIFEVKALGVQIGSISGGGRYDNLTGAFGMPGLSGVGISFGVDRIFDVIEELQLFPDNQAITTKLLFCFFDEESQIYALPLLQKVRSQGINAEIYPDMGKIKKQLDYANRKQMPFVIMIGEDERNTGQLTLKNMTTGEQTKGSFEELVKVLKG